jgi:hypothetical protein
MIAARGRTVCWAVAGAAFLLWACGSSDTTSGPWSGLGTDSGSGSGGASSGSGAGGPSSGSTPSSSGGSSGSGSSSGGGTSSGSGGSGSGGGTSSGSGGTGSGGGSGSGSGGGSGTGNGSGSGSGGGSGSGSGSDGGTGGPPTVQMFDTNCLSVPDPDVAASADLFGMVGQWHAYFYKKTTGILDHTYTWSALRGSLVSDTHIVFDIGSQRWFLTTILDLGNNVFAVQIMVSTDAAATTWMTSVPATMTGLIDNPQPTVTSDKVLLVFHGNCLWVVDKVALYAGNAAIVQPSTCALMPSDNVVAVKYGGTPPSTAYAVTQNDATTLNWISVDGTQAANNIQVQQHPITVPIINATAVFGAVKQNGMDIESGEVKAMWQSGHLVWARSVTCASGTCDRVFDINTTANTVTSHDFSLAGTQLWFGVPGLDRAGNTWVLMAEAAPAGNVGLALAGVFASGRTYAPNIIVTGQSVITGGNRFGDYFSAAQDPVDGSSWLIGQYAGKVGSSLNPENSTGCKVVHVTAN